MSTLRSSGAFALAGALLASSLHGAALGQTFTPAEGDPLIPYTSIADSPFFGDGTTCYSNETFPDGTASVGGWSFDSTAGAAIVETSTGAWALQQGSDGVVTLDFTPDDDGSYPSRIGFVWTGGVAKGLTQIQLDVTSADDQMATQTYADLPANPPDDPAGDLFFGVTWETGVQRVVITFDPSLDVPNQIDDIQFSAFTAPTPLAPANEDVGTLPTYRWSVVSCATWYQLWINDSTGNRLAQWYTAEEVGADAGECSLTPDVALNLGNVTWWVRAWNATEGNGPWSAATEFNVPMLTPPVAVAPIGAIDDVSPTYRWEPVPTATWYRLWINDSTGNRLVQWYTAEAVGADTGECSITPDLPLNPGDATWWVQAWNEDQGTGPWSEATAFVVPSLAAPVPIAPTGTIGDTLPTYRWEPVAIASWYRLWINDSTGNRLVQWYTAEEVGAASGECSITPDVALNPGSATWWVQAWNATEGTGPWSTATAFSVGDCAVLGISPTGENVESSGGSFSFEIDMNGDTCPWTATVQEGVDWISIDAGSESGTGDGTVLFTVAENPELDERTGAILVEGVEFTVVQSGVSCAIVLNPTEQTFDSLGGTGEFQVDIATEICTWTASTDDSWITLDTLEGEGDGPVAFTVAEYLAAGDRVGTITVGDQTFTVTQTAACSVTSIDPTSTEADVEGGSFTFAVVLSETTCEWSATSDDDWIVVTTGSGTGDGDVAFTVAANDTTEERVGIVAVGGVEHTVTQPAGSCLVTGLSPSSAAFGASAGTGSFLVVVNGENCEWTASTTDEWINLDSATGIGNASATFAVAENNSPSARTGTVTVEISGTEDEEQTFEISQGAACAVTAVDPTSAEFPEAGGSGMFAVELDSQECDWTATTDAEWITLSTSSGTGDGSVDYVVAINTDSEARTATIAVGDLDHTVVQEPACAVLALDPADDELDSMGGSGSVTVVMSRTDCDWEATTEAEWITLDDLSGTGAGSFGYTVDEYGGTVERVGVVTVGGQSFTITQTSSCTVTLEPSEASFEAAGGNGTIAVSTSLAGCTWTPTTESDWISIGTSSGTGDGTVAYAVSAWDGAVDREGTITVGGADFTVTQAAACAVTSISPDPGTYLPIGGSGTFTITTSTSDCPWTIENDADWLALDQTEGVGTTTVGFTVPEYSGAGARTATITVGDQSITIDQSAFCNVESIDPTSENFTEEGGSGTITVVTDSDTCEWTATTEADWVTIDVVGGVGDGTVEFTVAVNENAEQRQAVIEIAGFQFDVLQGTADCLVESIAPASADFPSEGGGGAFAVTVNGDECDWTATSDVDWVVVDTPGGTGSGVVSYTVSANGGITEREGTITILGETHSVLQEAGACEATSIDPESTSFSIDGGDGLFGVTLNDESCAWTAESDVEWIVVQDTSGTGSGSIAYTVATNATDEPRSGTITVLGLEHRVNQAGDDANYVFDADQSYEALPDSPFFGTGQACFELEFFPGGALSVPGLSFNAGAATIVTGTGVAPGTHVLQSSSEGVIRLAIDADTVSGGRLPSRFGFVWTGGSATSITITPTSGSGIASGPREFTDLPPNNPNEASDNRFFGIEWDERISAVEIVFDPPSTIYRIDQIQFDIEPAECENGQPDLNGDGWNDMILQNKITGEIQVQLLLDGEAAGLVPAGNSITPQDYVRSIGNWAGGGRAAIAWRNIFSGQLFGWRMNGAVFSEQYQIQPTESPDKILVGSGDLDEDGTDELVWQNEADRVISYWTMGPNGQPTTFTPFPTQLESEMWELIGVGDFNGDGRADLLWQDVADDSLTVWYLDENLEVASVGLVTSDAPESFSSLVAGVADYDNDGIADILWQVGFNTYQLWFMQQDAASGELSIRENATPSLDVDDFDLWRVRGG